MGKTRKLSRGSRKHGKKNEKHGKKRTYRRRKLMGKKWGGEDCEIEQKIYKETLETYKKQVSINPNNKANVLKKFQLEAARDVLSECESTSQ